MPIIIRPVPGLCLENQHRARTIPYKLFVTQLARQNFYFTTLPRKGDEYSEKPSGNDKAILHWFDVQVRPVL
jgi:hypothetical protein